MPQKTTILLKNYEELVASGKISNDLAQREVLGELQAILNSFTPKKRISLLKKQKIISKNLYIWGNVGRGKSMLMDLFFANAPVEKKRRVHFHAFMQEVHARIHEIRKAGLGDPVALLARQIAGENSLLCFDELQATDVADASILYRLFEGLFAGNVCIVSTSNRPPEELYQGGVQAERFDSFIALLKDKMKISALSSMEDYRYKQGKNSHKNYYFPVGSGADRFIAETLANLRANSAPSLENLEVQGRGLSVLVYYDKIARFTFADLCEKPLGAADYLAIASHFPIVIITDIPALTPEKRNEAKRFVTLIDALYEHKTKLFYTAQTAPEKIYDDGDGAFEFQRTVSRLTEIGSANY
jgi:cell division protein ZapE